MSTMKISRRSFAKAVGVLGATAVVATPPTQAAPASDREEFHGMLIDTTLCVGCRACEVACAEYKNLPPPDLGVSQVEVIRATTPNQLTVVNRYATDAGYVFAKSQCMHCNQPGCASACLTKALVKNETGHVTWDGDKCMGCRMCMVSCPFDVPKFEYNAWNPAIMKCDLCYDRTTQGKVTACAEACPAKAILFGTRRELLKTARNRIETKPDKYFDHIYGEHEAGGTAVMYLSAVPFNQIGKEKISPEPYPKLSKPFLSIVPLVFTIFPVAMLALNRATRKVQSEDREETS